jgi:hypothetical protein
MDLETSSSLDLSSPAIAGQQEEGGSLFPFVIGCGATDATREASAAWMAAERAAMLQHAAAHGTVLFRGFPLKTAEDFDAFITGLGLENFPYKKSLSNAVRINKTERVFTANESPPTVDILFHHEMAQTPIYPKWIMFFCEKAADEGGATQLCRSDWLYNRLAEECAPFVRACEEKGLKYTNVMPDENDPDSGMGRSWRSTLGVDSKAAAEARLGELNYTHEWIEGDCLRATTPQLNAVMEVSPGRRVFFNQLIAAYGGWKDSRNDPADAIRHGDGSKLDAEAVRSAIAISEEISFEAHWQAGDVALIDNTVVMHGRRPFVGTRKVLASLGEMRTQAFERVG